MTLRCDHCRRPLGLMVRRYWHMRFCSTACMVAYQRRLEENTREKIAKLRGMDGEARGAPRFTARLFGSRPRPETNRGLGG